MPPVNDWTESEIKTLREMARTYTVAEVAAHLGRTHRNVRHRAYVLSIPFYHRGALHPAAKHSTETIREVIALHKQGMSYQQISVRTGVKESYVWDIVSYRRRWTETMAMGDD